MKPASLTPHNITKSIVFVNIKIHPIFREFHRHGAETFSASTVGSPADGYCVSGIFQSRIEKGRTKKNAPAKRAQVGIRLGNLGCCEAD